jgi:hypothetical protein
MLSLFYYIPTGIIYAQHEKKTEFTMLWSIYELFFSSPSDTMHAQSIF